MLPDFEQGFPPCCAMRSNARAGRSRLGRGAFQDACPAHTRKSSHGIDNPPLAGLPARRPYASIASRLRLDCASIEGHGQERDVVKREGPTIIGRRRPLVPGLLRRC